jgi:hypothetical protein
MGRTPNGNIVALLATENAADRELVSLAGDTGAVRWRQALPRRRGDVTLNVDCHMGYDSYGDDTSASATALTIDETGTTYLYVSTGSSFFDYAAGGECEMYAAAQEGTLSLMKITETGSVSETTLQTYAVSQTGPAPGFELPTYTSGTPGTMVPVAGGGVVATYTTHTISPGSTTADTILTTHDAATFFTNHYPTEVGAVADAEDGRVVVSDGAQIQFVDTASGATTASYNGELVEVLADNEVLVINDGQVEHRDQSGSLIDAGPGILEAAVRMGQALWAKLDASGVSGIVSLDSSSGNVLNETIVGETVSAIRFPRWPFVENLTGLVVVVKNEGCLAGFDTVGPFANYYRRVDGVKPVLVNGWGILDWFKIPDFAWVVVNPYGDQPTAGGPSSLIIPEGLPFSQKFCRQDDPSQPNYVNCWGRRVEPTWSDSDEDGGLNFRDWRYPRPVGEDVCNP